MANATSQNYISRGHMILLALAARHGEEQDDGHYRS